MAKTTSTRREAPQETAASAYDPDARFDLVVSDVELRRNTAGRMLMARVYQPKGPWTLGGTLGSKEAGIPASEARFRRSSTNPRYLEKPRKPGLFPC